MFKTDQGFKRYLNSVAAGLAGLECRIASILGVVPGDNLSGENINTDIRVGRNVGGVRLAHALV